MRARKDRTVMVYFSDDEMSKLEEYAKTNKWKKGSAVRFIVDEFFQSTKKATGGDAIGGKPGSGGIEKSVG